MKQRIAKSKQKQVRRVKRISARSRQIESEFSSSDPLLQMFFELSADAVFIGHQSGTIDYANSAACRMFGYSVAEFKRLGGFMIVDRTDPDYLAFIKRRKGHGTASGEMALIQKDGTKFEAEVSGAYMLGADGRQKSILIVRDIRARKQAEREKNQLVVQLRELMRLQNRAREDERAAVAREIHDEFGQVLTALKIDLALLTRRLSPNQRDLASKIESMLELIQTAKTNVQRLATELRPGVLDELGFIDAAEWQLRKISERSGLKYDFHVSSEEMKIEIETATALFRILQEALTNVLRHAQATRVWVNLNEEPTQLRMTIRDNGRGIRKSQLAHTDALGLLGMRERAGALGGKISIEGKPGKGTIVTAEIPRLMG